MNVIQRGCGFPIAGGVYLKTDISIYGTPWQYFVYDPPVPIYEPEQMGISAQGISFIENGDHFNAIDWVGASHYPYVPCFIEEGLLFGFSRRIPKTADFSKITPDSKHILIHKRAYIKDPLPYYEKRMKKSCPKEKEHPEHLVMSDYPCIELLWEAMDHGKKVADRGIDYEMPSFKFHAWQSPEGVTPEFQLGAFMWLPINRIEVVYDNIGGTHEKALEILRKSGTEIPYEVQDYGEEVNYDDSGTA